MGPFWGYGWWCLLPLLVFGVLAVACMFMGARRGGGCGCAMRGGTAGEPPRARGPDA